MKPRWLPAFSVFLGFSACSGSSPKTPEPNPVPSRPPSANSDRFVIDKAASRFTAHVGVSGALAAFGHEHVVAIREFSGEARLTPGTIEPADLRMTIDAPSLAETGTEFSEADRKKIDQDVRQKALEVAKYQQILFKSVSVSAKKAADGQFQVQIAGALTLHGITKVVTIPAQISLQGGTLTARGEFKIRHSDFGIERLSAAAGTVKAKDEITLSFTIVARQAQGAAKP